MTVVTVGNLAIVGIPGELFVELGLAIEGKPALRANFCRRLLQRSDRIYSHPRRVPRRRLRSRYGANRRRQRRDDRRHRPLRAGRDARVSRARDSTSRTSPDALLRQRKSSTRCRRTSTHTAHIRGAIHIPVGRILRDAPAVARPRAPGRRLLPRFLVRPQRASCGAARVARLHRRPPLLPRQGRLDGPRIADGSAGAALRADARVSLFRE